MKKVSHYIYLVLLLTLSFSAAPMVHAAGTPAGGQLYLSPSSGVYRVGEPFVINVLANTGGQRVNALEAELSYNPSDFAVETISTDNSILTSWSTTPAYDGASGIIKFSGWAGKQYSGKDGLLIVVTLRPLRVAQSIVTFNSGAMLAADGQGSNIITVMSSGNYTATPAQIIPPALPDTSTTTAATTTQQEQAPEGNTLVPVLSPSSDQAASLISSGVELAPAVSLFFVILTLIAFSIAYVLHRNGVR